MKFLILFALFAMVLVSSTSATSCVCELDCTVSERCISGTCTAISASDDLVRVDRTLNTVSDGGMCTISSQCSSTSSCRDGICTAKSVEDASCNVDDDCVTGMSCLRGSCYDPYASMGYPFCRNNTQCTSDPTIADDVCYDNVCSEPCTKDEDCTIASQVCNPIPDVGGRCLNYDGDVECDNDIDCIVDQYCKGRRCLAACDVDFATDCGGISFNDEATDVCSGVTGPVCAVSTSYSFPCNIDTDCNSIATGSICMNHKCVATCVDDDIHDFANQCPGVNQRCYSNNRNGVDSSVCADIVTDCETDAECLNDAAQTQGYDTCHDGTCVSFCPNGLNSECRTGEECRLGMCFQEVTCVDNTDCDGLACIRGQTADLMCRGYPTGYDVFASVADPGNVDGYGGCGLNGYNIDGHCYPLLECIDLDKDDGVTCVNTGCLEFGCLPVLEMNCSYTGTIGTDRTLACTAVQSLIDPLPSLTLDPEACTQRESICTSSTRLEFVCSHDIKCGSIEIPCVVV